MAGPVITTANAAGRQFSVNQNFAPNFTGFVNDLAATGYPIKDVQGYNNRNIEGTNTPSYHASGAAIDINPDENPVNGSTNFPANVSALAAKWGLGWGGNWSNKKDPMHFSAAKEEGGAYDMPHIPSGSQATFVSASQPNPDDALLNAYATSRTPAPTQNAPATAPSADDNLLNAYANSAPIQQAPDPSPAPQAASAASNGPSSVAPTPGDPSTVQGRLGVVYNGVVRGLHQGLDVPAEALARGADYVAGKFGYPTTQGQQTAATDQQFNQAYDADPANQGLGPAASRLAGNIVSTLPAAIASGGLASGAAQIGARAIGAASPIAGAAVAALPAMAGGVAAGATTAAQTGQPIGDAAAMGGALGAGAGIIGQGVNRLLSSSSPAVARAVDTYGIPLRAGQVSQNRLVRYLDDITAPQSSNLAQRQAVNTAAARTMGVSPEVAQAANLPANQVTPEIMQFAKGLNGGIMNGVESRTTILPEESGLLTNLAGIESSASKSPSAFGDIKPHLNDIIDTIAANNGTLPGKAYGELVAKGSPLDAALNSDNSTVRQYAGSIKSVLQDAMQSSATPADAAAYQQARLQYKNMMTLAPLVNKGIPGDISPLLLQGAANRSFKNNAFSGAGDLGELGDIAQTYLKAPPQSGTEPRTFIRNSLYADTKGLLQMGARMTAGTAVNRLLGASPVTGPFVQGNGGGVPSMLLLRNQLAPNPN